MDEARGIFERMDTFAGGFPVRRLRRLRTSAGLRDLVADTNLSRARYVLPLFSRPGKNLRKPVGSMPGVYQLSQDELLKECEVALNCGVQAVLLFGIPDSKDEQASGAYAENGIVQETIHKLKSVFPQLIVITDVCLCEYMSHGH